MFMCTRLPAALLVLLLSLGAVACDGDDAELEEGTQEIEEGGEDAGDAVEEGADDVEAEVEDEG